MFIDSGFRGRNFYCFGNNVTEWFKNAGNDAKCNNHYTNSCKIFDFIGDFQE
jgi:hypothetical protein